ncbi:uncharacterized protein RHOBADRAFT_36269 [Rhodotorula graminis WP1]|uniref:Het-C-domain-containing protein n=1 Tax=Rhodotorula graminis (strain WP1) TaxID=578459 RepID=A0A194S7M4_RHOGW|nr:uncharacterized protein RHOBADRAFT_36269 [Rhodotorula graminis WP1]KPV75411.1 hypothetical protein RHOBADRAFT_36269 [Rhodotorula graminis WP1]
MAASSRSIWSGNLPVFFVLVCLLCIVPSAHAFGAGNIPSYSFLEGKAFRHGDIEDALAELIKKSGGILGRGSKFGGLDIKRVYFGNWLRDYSQAMDIAGLTKLAKQTILNLVMALGFLAHGYATGEFEVTDERLGVYLCTEHIDNPKGYAADQPGGDARRVDPRLRGPVMDVELQVDPRTGMKNYIANENGNWDTSSRLVRERIVQCIDMGRRARNGGGETAVYEAYRLLGTLLHTLEDFTAHSNWCELSLLRLGYSHVFPHVGDGVRVQSPAGPCPPLVTGTFGGSDFIHSLLGEATDHISEASVSDLAKAMDGARSTDRGIGGSSTSDTLRKLLFDLPGSSGSDLSREMGDIEDIRSRAANGSLSELSPQELHATLWKVLTFRDNVVKGIENTIEKIPGLSALTEKITNSVNAFVFTTIEPMIKPIMGQATQVLTQGSAAVIDNPEQYEVFSNPHASDPSHSFLSKDHFALLLNEPAGQVAVVILSYTVKLIVKAWEDNSQNPQDIAHKVLAAFHHPYFYDDSQEIQRLMGETLKKWIDGQSAEDKRFILAGLTKDAVKSHKNRRKGHEADQEGHGAHGSYNSVLMPQGVGAFAQQHVPGAQGAMNTFNQAQHKINHVSNQFNQATSGVWGGGGGQHGGRRDYDDGQSGGFQEPQSGYMPPMGAPPQAVHGGAPQFNEFNQPHTSSGYPGAPPPQPQHSYGGSAPSFGGGGPSYGDDGGYGGGAPGFGGQQHHHQQGPPPPQFGGGGGGGGYGGPPQGGYDGGYGGQPQFGGGGGGGPQQHFGGQPQFGGGGPPPPPQGDFYGQPQHQQGGQHGHHGGQGGYNAGYPGGNGGGGGYY